MNAQEIRQNIISKFILLEFAEGRISTQSEFNELASVVASRLEIPLAAAAIFIGNTIGL